MAEDPISAAELNADAARWDKYFDTYEATQDGLIAAIRRLMREYAKTDDPDFKDEADDLEEERLHCKDHFDATDREEGRVRPPEAADVTAAITKSGSIANRTGDAQTLDGAIVVATSLATTFRGLHA